MADCAERRALILDFDGVLVDSEPIHYASWTQAFEQLFGHPLEGDAGSLVGLSLNQIYAHWAASNALELSDAEKDALLARKSELFYAIGAGQLKPIPGSVELIRRARVLGWYVAISSRSRRLRLHGTLDLMQMPALFDVVLGCEDVVDAETDRKDHARAARIFGIDPACCVVIEDSASGIADALAAGIGWVIGLTTSLDAASLSAAGAHEVVDCLDAVKLPGMA